MTGDPLHLVFVGSMGAGKTTVGKLAAVHLGLAFIDGDELLALVTMRTAAQIAVDDGLDILHGFEAGALLKALSMPDPSVVAASASVVDSEACREALRDFAFVVWLTADPAVLDVRAATGTHRPQLDIAALLVDRADRYEEVAHLAIDVRDHDAVAAAELAAVAYRAALSPPS